MVVIMFEVYDVSDSLHSFLKLYDVSYAGNTKMMFIHLFVVCSLCVHYIISIAFCHEDMTI